MKISIIICTYNHLDSLKKTISALEEVRVPSGAEAELLIVENACTDGTAEYIEAVQLQNMKNRPLHEPERGQVRARNRGLSVAEGDYIFFIDDDVRPAVDWLERMYARLNGGGFDAVAGCVRIAPHLVRPWMTRRLRASLAATEGLEDGWLTEMIGANMAFRRRVLERVPRFDDELGPGALGYGDDSLFSWQLEQAGFAMGRAPEAVVEHHFEESRLLRRFLLESARRTGQSNAYLLHHWKHEKIRWPMVYLGMTYLKLARRRLISGKDMVDGEGCSEWEMSITTEQRRYRQYMIERRRLRNYERHGLIKLQESSTLEARSINTVAGQAVNPDTGARSQLLRFLGFLALLCIAFCRPLITLLEFCAGSELNSYILLVPFVSAYLLYLQRKSLKGGFGSSSGWAVLFAAIAIVAYWCSNKFVSQNDRISLQMLSFVCLMYCGGFLFLGRKWIAKAAFPVSFLAFLIPLPYQVVDRLETASKLASADCAAFFYWLFDIPVLRDTQDGTVFQLPNIALRVAQECSGIHSSLILVIASLIACHLLLKSFWRRAGLIVFAIALGVVRNGFRIATLGWLCVHIGPQMIDSPIHHRGGPIFFVLSLIPLLLLLWVLCKGDRKIFPANGSGLQRDPTIP